MPLTYTTPPSYGTIATSVINSVTFDLVAGTAYIGVAHFDAGGNQIATESITIPNVPAGTLSTVKTSAYNRLIALRGAGTVT